MPSSAKSSKRLVEELPRLLAERGMTVTALARAAGVNQSFLSKVLRQAHSKTPSGDLARRLALALDLPEDYFIEFRERAVIDAVRADDELRERIYAEISGWPAARRRPTVTRN